MKHGDRIIITRKPHRCRICDEEIPVGMVHRYHGVGPDGWYSEYYHDECYEYSLDWTDSDWDEQPGGVSRVEVRKFLDEESQAQRQQAEAVQP